MLLGIFTIMEEKEIRNKLREYIYRNPKRADPRLCSLPEFIQKQEEGQPCECQVVYTFVIGANTGPNGQYIHRDDSKTPLIVNQQYIADFEPDVTYLNVHENMNKGKTPTWFKYANGLSRSFGENGFNYIGKLDSDTLISVPNLIHMINHDLPSEAKNVYGGIVCDEKACGDPERCHEILQGKVYMTGQFYFLSLDLASYVSDDALNRAAISSYSEDVDMGLWVHSSNQILKLVILNNKNVFWIHNVKNMDRLEEKYTDYFVRQRKFPMYTFWLKPKWWD